MNQNIQTFNNIEDLSQESKAIPFKKFALYTLCTFGLYLFYFNYTIWKNIKKERNLKIIPILRTIFFIFFTGSFARNSLEMAQEKGYAKTFNSIIIFTGCFVGSLILKRATEPLNLLGLVLIIIMLKPALEAYNYYWIKQYPLIKISEKFSPTGMVVIVIGGLLLVLSVIGSFIPEQNEKSIKATITDDNN